MEPMNQVVPGFDLPTVVYAKDQPEYIPLPCLKEDDGVITIRWKLSWRERWLIFRNGCLWHQVNTFNEPLQPIKLSAVCPLPTPFSYPDEV